MANYDPWAHLRRCFPDVRVIATHPLPGGQLGGILGGRIWLHRDLNRAGRRCTLAHEIVHLERIRASGRRSAAGGYETPPADGSVGWCDRREERAVDAIAARRLIGLDRLVEALRWSSDRAEVAADLDVDLGMLSARWTGLDPGERRAIDRQLGYPASVHE